MRVAGEGGYSLVCKCVTQDRPPHSRAPIHMLLMCGSLPQRSPGASHLCPGFTPLTGRWHCLCMLETP